MPDRPGLIAFAGTRQTKRGVTYRISKLAGRKRIESGFIAVMPSGHRGAFSRSDSTRLPIGEAKGPSIWKVIIGTPGLLKAATDTAGKRLSKKFNRLIFRNKKSQVAVTAVARELAGFVWGLMVGQTA